MGHLHKYKPLDGETDSSGDDMEFLFASVILPLKIFFEQNDISSSQWI